MTEREKNGDEEGQEKDVGRIVYEEEEAKEETGAFSLLFLVLDPQDCHSK